MKSASISHLLWFALVSAFPTVPAAAQNQEELTWQYKMDFFANIAYGYVLSPSQDWGQGRDYGGGVGFRPFSGAWSGLGFEAQVARLHSVSAPSPISGAVSRWTSTMFAANVPYHFRGRTMTQPYVLGGIGWMSGDYHYEHGAFTDPTSGTVVPAYSRTVNANRLGLTLGGGVKAAFTRHIALRMELFNLFARGREHWLWLRAQIGLGYHF